MSLWAEIPLLFFVILGILIGFFSLFLVFFPGLTVIWASIFVWGLSTSFNRSVGPWTFTVTIATFVVVTLLMLFGNVVDNFFMAGSARSKGASWLGIGLSWVAMIVGGIVFTPLGGLGLSMLVLFITELIRLKEHHVAFQTLSSMAMGCGWAVMARLGIAMMMIALFVMWYFMLYQ